MEGATLTRNEIVNWVNDQLQLKYTKIEQMGTGAALVQLMDIIFPGKIGLTKVNYNAKYDYEYIKNFSYLQESFSKLGVDKPIEVSELVKLRPQANLEFCQWFKKFFDQHYTGEPYDALQRRVQLKITTDSDKVLLKGSKPAAAVAKPATTTAVASKPTAAASVTKTPPPATTTTPKTTPTVKPTATAATKTPAAKPASSPTAKTPAATTTPKSITKPAAATTTTTKATTTTTTTTTKPTMAQPSFKPTTARVSPKPSSPTPDVSAELYKQIEEKDAKIAELKESLTNFEKIIGDIEMDRDFYLTKLKMVESFCANNKPLVPVLQKILTILYEETEENSQKIADEILVIEDLEKMSIESGNDQVEQQEEEEEEQVEQQEGEVEEQVEHVEEEQEQEQEGEVEEVELEGEVEEHIEEEEILEGEDELNEDEILEQYGNEPIDDDDVLNSTIDGDDEDLIDQEEF
ncbi:hypothetical protein CYY_000182 [Polysphondylium violaceum]|uniref:Microtubule-associated protein EB1 n=1 Tax=Polysphondylium violaceum TaxID=133409 RepID=A0A8J4Q4A0_9MYCE|nr:hypothetical protein CYY_000182 [Polysphondylium violaceum]